jgi:hypothetical protein
MRKMGKMVASGGGNFSVKQEIPIAGVGKKNFTTSNIPSQGRKTIRSEEFNYNGYNMDITVFTHPKDELSDEGYFDVHVAIVGKKAETIRVYTDEINYKLYDDGLAVAVNRVWEKVLGWNELKEESQ